jgi:beta-lactamase regulating signal transducer with metallopeptidase domain
MNTLLAALVNGSIVSIPLVAAVWIALRFSRRWLNAATRYGVWWIVLALVVVLMFEPYMHVRPRPVPLDTTRTAAVTSPVFADQKPAAPMQDAQMPRSGFPIPLPIGAWSRRIIELWVFLATLMLTRLVVSYVLLRKMKRDATDAPDALAVGVQALLQRLGVKRAVRIAVVDHAASPMVAGPFSPAILLPAGVLKSMQETEIEQISLHEAAHLARRDDYALLLQRFVEALFVAHPLVRWIGWQLNLEREIACDDVVISVTGARLTYAACLTRVAEFGSAFAHSSVPAIVGNERSHLTQRVEMLLDKTRHAGTRLLGIRFAVLAVNLALLALLAAGAPAVLAVTASRVAKVQHDAPALPALARVLVAQTRQAETRQAETRATPANQSPAQQVRVAVTVTDPMNRFVTGLNQDAFHVFENGVELKIVGFNAQEEPLSIGIVWGVRKTRETTTAALETMLQQLARLRRTYPPEHPDVKATEARIDALKRAYITLANPQPVIDAAPPGSRVTITRVGENQSLVDGLEAAFGQRGGMPGERSAIVIVFDPADWMDQQIAAAVRAAGVRVYALGLTDPFDTSTPPSAKPALITGTGAAAQYPAVGPEQIEASINGMVVGLRNQYVITYVPSEPGEQGKYRQVDVRITEPVGLPHLTARSSTGYSEPAK